MNALQDHYETAAVAMSAAPSPVPVDSFRGLGVVGLRAVIGWPSRLRKGLHRLAGAAHGTSGSWLGKLWQHESGVVR